MRLYIAILLAGLLALAGVLLGLWWAPFPAALAPEQRYLERIAGDVRALIKEGRTLSEASNGQCPGGRPACGRVSVIDSKTDTVLGRAAVGLDPFGLAGACGTPGDQLEKEVEAELTKEGIPILERNKKIFDAAGKEIGEIDFVVENALIEVTVSPSGKLSQIKNYLTKVFNPAERVVILYAPKYGGAASKDVEAVGGLVEIGIVDAGREFGLGKACGGIADHPLFVAQLVFDEKGIVPVKRHASEASGFQQFC
jgi:hypothetical protein